MENKDLTTRIINSFFCGSSPSSLWKQCPNHMLWEATKKAHSTIISQHDIPQFLENKNEIIHLPEPLTEIHTGAVPVHERIDCVEFLKKYMPKIMDSSDDDSFYIVSSDFAWMLIITAENTADGDRLCVLVNKQMHRSVEDSF